METGAGGAFRFDDVAVDVANFQLKKAGEAVAIEPLTFRLLVYLVEHRGRLIGKEELIREVWNGAFVTDNALTRAVAQLRKALGDQARQARYIETVPTQGYRFIADVEEAAVPVSTLVAQPAVSGLHRRRGVPAVAAALVLSGAVAWWIWPRQPSPAAVKATSQFTSSSGLELSPSFSPDGAMAAYSADTTGRFEIYVRPLAPGGRDIQVTGDGRQNLQPAWSPDGRYLAYHSLTRGGLWIVPATGGTPRRLTEFGVDPVWSPDGGRIAFRRAAVVGFGLGELPPESGSTLYWVAAGGGEPAPLTKQDSPPGAHGRPSWSPDGRRLVFASYSMGTRLWTIGADGSGLSELPVKEFALLDPAFAPDGRSVYASARIGTPEAGIWQFPLDGGTPREIVRTGVLIPRDVALSRDGSRLAYSLLELASNIWALPLDPRTSLPGGEAMPLTRENSYRVTFPVFSPDASRIAYHVRRRGQESDVWVMNADGSSARQVTAHPGADLMPNWTPDGRWLVYTSRRGGVAHLVMTSLEDGSEKTMPDPGMRKALARLSPDGRWFAYMGQEAGQVTVWRAELATGRSRRLTEPAASIGYPTWSRDGRWLCVEKKTYPGTVLGIMPAEGGELTPLVEAPSENWCYSWSPGNDRIAYAALRDGVWNLHWVSRSTRREQRLTDNELARVYLRYPEWSPKGDRIVYEFAETKGNLFVAELR